MKHSRKSVIQSLFKGGSIVFAGLVIEIGISFFAKILMARVLGQVEYGVATLGITTLSFASTVLLLGLNNGVGRYLPRFEDPASRKGVIASALRMAIPFAVAVALGVGLFAEPIALSVLRAPEATPVLRAAAVGIPFAVLLKLAMGVVQGMEQTAPKVIIRNVLQPLLRFSLIAAVLVLGFRSVGIVWAYTATAAVAGSAGLYYIVTRTPALEDVVGVRMHRRLVSFSAPLMLMTTIMMVLSNIDIFFISYFGTTGSVGTYNVVYPLSELPTMALSGFSFIFMPVFSRLHASGQEEDMHQIYQTVTKWIVLLSLPVMAVFLLYPAPTIGLTFGSEYRDGALALIVLSLGFFSHTVAGPNVNALTSLGRTKTIMFSNIGAVIVNIVLNLILIPPYSYLGAAVATAVSYAVLNLLYSLLLYRATGIQPFDRHLLEPLAAAVVVALGVYTALAAVFTGSAWTVVIFLLLFLPLYLATIVRFGAIQEEEEMLILSIEERFDVDLGTMKQMVDRFA